MLIETNGATGVNLPSVAPREKRRRTTRYPVKWRIGWLLVACAQLVCRDFWRDEALTDIIRKATNSGQRYIRARARARAREGELPPTDRARSRWSLVCFIRCNFIIDTGTWGGEEGGDGGRGLPALAGQRSPVCCGRRLWRANFVVGDCEAQIRKTANRVLAASCHVYIARITVIAYRYRSRITRTARRNIKYSHWCTSTLYTRVCHRTSPHAVCLAPRTRVRNAI